MALLSLPDSLTAAHRALVALVVLVVLAMASAAAAGAGARAMLAVVLVVLAGMVVLKAAHDFLLLV